MPKPTPPAAQREAQLAIERDKQKKLEQEKKLEEERQKRKEKELKEKKEKEKLDKEKHAKLEKEKLEREKLEKEKLEKDKKEKAKHKAEQEAKDRAEAKRMEADRQANLKRIAGMAGATGGPTDTGTALKASGPSASYAGRIRGKVKPNIVFGEDIAGNPTAEVEVKCAPDGTILSKRLLQSSGHKSWDDAVIKALEKTEILPRDTDGRVPPVLVISFRPKD
jgi:colicin import membrane protein